MKEWNSFVFAFIGSVLKCFWINAADFKCKKLEIFKIMSLRIVQHLCNSYEGIRSFLLSEQCESISIIFLFSHFSSIAENCYASLKSYKLWVGYTLWNCQIYLIWNYCFITVPLMCWQIFLLSWNKNTDNAIYILQQWNIRFFRIFIRFLAPEIISPLENVFFQKFFDYQNYARKYWSGWNLCMCRSIYLFSFIYPSTTGMFVQMVHPPYLRYFSSTLLFPRLHCIIC